MPNWCYTTYRITGKKEELERLLSLIERAKHDNKAQENSNWVGFVTGLLGGTPEDLYMRSWIEVAEMDGDSLMIQTEDAWGPVFGVWDYICSRFKTLRLYFEGEEPGCGVYRHRPNYERGWFTDEYKVEYCKPRQISMSDEAQEYFGSLESALSFVSRVSERKVGSESDVESLNSEWAKMDSDSYIYLNKFKNVDAD